MHLFLKKEIISLPLIVNLHGPQQTEPDGLPADEIF